MLKVNDIVYFSPFEIFYIVFFRGSSLLAGRIYGLSNLFKREIALSNILLSALQLKGYKLY
jgi:hypothetical protein